MNIAVIFAGGVGSRMHSKERPKQFLEMYNKPIIIHTIEHFENHPMIDAIIVVCIESWIPYLNKLLYKFRIEKVKKVVPGGETGQLSIYNGLKAAKEIAGEEKSIVLIHDGVRPLITEKLITDNIESVKSHGSAITTAPVKETTLVVNPGKSTIDYIPSRPNSRVAKAPQSFLLDDILEAHEKTLIEGTTTRISPSSRALTISRNISREKAVNMQSSFATQRSLYIRNVQNMHSPEASSVPIQNSSSVSMTRAIS